MRSPMQADASKHAPSRPVSRHTLSVSGRFRSAGAFPRPLVVYSAAYRAERCSTAKQQRECRAPQAVDSCRNRPHSPPESPKKPVDAAASTGFFVE